MTLTPSSISADIAVLGSGPAGLALTAELAARGARVLCVDPAPHSPWPNSYGSWEDELPFSDVSEHRWTMPTVWASNRRLAIPRVYVTLDNERLRRRLADRAAAHGARFVPGLARELGHDGTGVDIVLQGGTRLRAAVVVDASGGATSFVERDGRATTWQLAWGMEVIVDGHPWQPDEMVLMDCAQGAWSEADSAPSFLYAMPFGPDRVFVEETWLATRRPGSIADLRQRLQRRLSRLGIRVRAVRRVERCRIPLDLPRPRAQAVVGFGASASMVHPISGYMVARALSEAGGVAEALLGGLGPGGDPRDASARAWRVVLRSSPLVRALMRIGLDALVTLDADKMNAFFETLFSLDPRHARALLDPWAAPGDVARAMAAMFRPAPTSLRRHLLRHALPRAHASAWVRPSWSAR